MERNRDKQVVRQAIERTPEDMRATTPNRVISECCEVARTKSIIIDPNFPFTQFSLLFAVAIKADCNATFDINMRAPLNATLLF
jgi:hypothetical protein